MLQICGSSMGCPPFPQQPDAGSSLLPLGGKGEQRFEAHMISAGSLSSYRARISTQANLVLGLKLVPAVQVKLLASERNRQVREVIATPEAPVVGRRWQIEASGRSRQLPRRMASICITVAT